MPQRAIHEAAHTAGIPKPASPHALRHSFATHLSDAGYVSTLPDFEDALQFAAARAASVNAIVTRNKKDFRQRHVPVFSPEEALDAIRRG